MARWTVIDGDQEFVIEAAVADQVTMRTPSGESFVMARPTVEDLRRKLALAISDTDPEPPS